MAALIKNALVKQISKYLKNVSANQINISTFKGEGEMTNIQLDENVLMDLLELPTWLRITSAKCNKAGVKVCCAHFFFIFRFKYFRFLFLLEIPWTKLKTNPIVIVISISYLMEIIFLNDILNIFGFLVRLWTKLNSKWKLPIN